MSKKAVLFTLDSFVPGGVVEFVKQYSNVISDKGYEAIILGKSGSLESPKNFFKDCRVIEIPKNKKTPFFNTTVLYRFVSFFEYIRYLRKVCSVYKINIIHLSTTWSSIYTMLYPTTWGVKKVVTFYGAYDLEMATMTVKNRKFGLIKKTFRKWLQYLTLDKSNKIIAFSSYSKSLICQHFSQTFQKKISIIPGFIEDSEVKSLKTKMHNKGVIRILNFGRAEPRKGIDLLIKSVKILSQKKQQFKLLLASPVEFFVDFKHLSLYEEMNLFDKVQFIHKVNHAQKEYLLSSCDVFVIPSIDYETFGMTILESLSKGIPVIGTPSGSIPEILNKVDSMLVCSGVSAEAISRKILWFSHLSLKKRASLSKKSQEVVKRFYSRRVNEQKVISIYSKL